MSIERELLEELSTKDMVSYYYPNLINRIKELLAQPETKQEPVAWMYERQIEGFTERTMSVGYEENFDGITIPLYLEPPTHEPLSDSDIYNHTPFHYHDAEQKAFAVGVRWAEQHGIGVGDE